METKPSIGRVVHYVSYGTPGGEFTSECRAAIITGIVPLVDGEQNPTGEINCSLAVFNPTGIYLNDSCPYDAEKSPGSWHWPERV